MTVSTSKKQVALTVKKKVDSEPIEMDFKAEEGRMIFWLLYLTLIKWHIAHRHSVPCTGSYSFPWTLWGGTTGATE